MKKLNEITVFSGIAIIFVVLQHSNSFYLVNILNYTSYDQSSFLTILNKVLTIAVSMFIFIGGYKYSLTGGCKDYSKYIIKKIKTIFLPFFIYGTIITIGLNLLQYILGNEFSVFNIITDIANSFIGVHWAYQLWYVPMYLVLLFIYPLIEKVIKNENNRMLFLVIINITAIILYNYSSIGYLLEYPYFMTFTRYLFIFELGIKTYEKRKFISKNILFMYLGSLLISCIITNNLILEMYMFLVIYPLGCLAFLYISNVLKESKVLRCIGRYSFYIYLFHNPIPIQGFGRILIRFSFLNNYSISLIITVLSIGLSILVYTSLQKLYKLFNTINKVCFKRVELLFSNNGIQ